MPPEPITIAGLRRSDRLRFRRPVDLGPDTALVGHSMGGFISTEAVISEPERFSSLTLVSAAGITFAEDLRLPQDATARLLFKMMLPIARRRISANLGRKRLRAASFAGVIAHPSHDQPGDPLGAQQFYGVQRAGSARSRLTPWPATTPANGSRRSRCRP